MSINYNLSVLLKIVLCLVLLPFVILAFFSHAGSDDYLMQMLYEKPDWFEIQKTLYTSWNGRFLANFLQIAGVKLNIVTNYYFAHSVLLFVLTYASAFKLVKTCNQFILNNSLSLQNIIQAAAIVLVLNIYLLANIGENFYWFSGALVYQSAIIILLLLFSKMIKRFNAASKRFGKQDIIICLLLILLSGCNETMPIAVLILLTLTLIYLYTYKNDYKKIVSVYWLLLFGIGLIVYLTSGVQNRQKFMNTETGIFSILFITAFRVLSVFYYLFREPLFWITALAVFLQGTQKTSATITINLKKTIVVILSMPLVIACMLLPILVLSKGSLPERALNNIILIAAWMVLSLSFLSGRSYASSQSFQVWKPAISFMMPLLFIISLTCSTSFVNAWKSVCSGYFYSKVLESRDLQFAEAKQKEDRSIQINSYTTDAAQQIQQTFPKGIFKSAYDVFLEKPTTIPFFNEAEASGAKSFYAQYYGVKEVVIRR